MAIDFGVVCLTAFSLFYTAWSDTLLVEVTPEGNYTVSWENGTVWLRSAPSFFIVNNVTYSSANQSLLVLGVNKTQHEGFTSNDIYYNAGGTVILASIQVSMYNYLSFSVKFPQGANGTAAQSPDGVICGFPGFQIDKSPARLAYLSYGGSNFGAALGRWEHGSAIVYGGRQGSGPLVLFDLSNNAIAMGPSTAFTVTSLWHDLLGGYVYWGIMGGVNSLPPLFQYSILMIGSEEGIGFVISLWAFAMPIAQHPPSGNLRKRAPGENQKWRHQLVYSGFKFIPIRPDSVSSRLSYWTAPGSAYFAAPETGKTYQETLQDVRQYALNETNQERLPYIYVELDSWWYKKGQDGRVKDWSAPSDVFPDGIRGLANKTSWLLAPAGGVWAKDTTYAKQNGGKYDFRMGDGCALPTDQLFWDDLFQDAIPSYIAAYVQNDVDQQYLCMTSGVSDLTWASTWLANLNVSAANHRVELMYTGILPRVAMEIAFNLKQKVVVQVAESNLTDASHWKVGVGNIFADSLGLLPYMGVIKTTRNASDPVSQLSPVLYSLLATITGGPVAVGDELGASNKMLIRRCCRNDGTILRATRPAKAIDAQLQQMAWGGKVGATGEVWTTFTGTQLNTDKGNNYFHGIILAAGMTAPFDLTPTSAGFNSFTAPQETVLYVPSKLFAYIDPTVLYDFTDKTPFTLKNCTIEDFCLYYVAPVITFKGHEIVIMGDLLKWVPMSPQLVVRVDVTDKINITTHGLPGEEVTLWVHVNGRLESLSHRIGSDGYGSVVYEERDPPPSAANTSTTILSMLVCLQLLRLLC